MKVFELINKLQQCDPNATVEFECDDDWYGGEISECRAESYKDGSAVVILRSE